MIMRISLGGEKERKLLKKLSYFSIFIVVCFHRSFDNYYERKKWEHSSHFSSVISAICHQKNTHRYGKTALWISNNKMRKLLCKTTKINKKEKCEFLVEKLLKHRNRFFLPSSEQYKRRRREDEEIVACDKC